MGDDTNPSPWGEEAAWSSAGGLLEEKRKPWRMAAGRDGGKSAAILPPRKEKVKIMSTRIDYAQIAAKLDYAALEKKLAQLGEREPPRNRKTAGDVLEPLREKLMALHLRGWSSAQLVAELKAAGVPVSPAMLRECLNRWNGNGNGAAKKRTRRAQKKPALVHPAAVASASPSRNRVARDDHQPGLKLS